MMANPDKENANRIPVRFVDGDESSSPGADGQAKTDTDTNDDAPSPDELGRASSYEDATEMQRRIDRGQEKDSGAGRSRADEADTAGGPKGGDVPERRE